MTISEIIAKRCTKKDIAIYGGKTSEDLLGDACLTALKKFKNLDISEEDGFAYLEKTFLEGCFFSYKKRGYDAEKMLVFIPEYEEE